MIELRMVEYFFRVDQIVDPVEKKKAAALSKFGAYVRTSARSSLVRRKKPSTPPSPPSVHSRHPTATLKNIQFAREGTDNVAIGMLRFTPPDGSSARGRIVSQSRLASDVQEHGGSVSRVVRQPIKRSGRKATPRQLIGLRSQLKHLTRPPPVTKQETARYPERPTMEPAGESNVPKFREMWRNAVT